MYTKLLCLVLILGFNYKILLFSDDIKFKRVLNTHSYNNHIAQDKDGMLWISTEGKGLFCYNVHDIKNIKIENSKNSVQIISSILVDHEGLIWFFIQGKGLYCYNKETGSYKNYNPEKGNCNSLTSNNFTWQPNTIAEDKEGIIWIGTIDGLNSYNKKIDRFTQYKYKPNDNNSLSNNIVTSVYVDSDGLIWIGTKDGLNCFNKNTGKFNRYKHEANNTNSLSDSHVRALTEDKEGFIWIGTKNTGIDKLDKKTGQFTNYRHNPRDDNSPSHNEIHHLMVDKLNNLWVCNEGNIGFDLYNIRINQFTHYSYDPKNPETINSNSRLCSFEDKSGIVWLIDSSGGLTKCTLKKNIFKHYVYDPKDLSGISSNDLASIYEDKNGIIWIGTYKGGMCSYTQDKFENFNHNASSFSLPDISVHSIIDAPDNKLWIGVKKGFLCLFDIGTKKVIKSFKIPYPKTIACYLLHDNKDPSILWFACSYAGGLFKMDTKTGKFTAYKHNPADKTSISSEITIGILQLDNILWIATGGDGLCKFDKITEKCIYYKHDSKDKNSISSDIVIQAFIDSRGNFWVTTDNGINKFEMQDEKFTNYGLDCGFPSKSTKHVLEDKEGFLWISTDSGIVKFDTQKQKVIRWFTTADGLPCNNFDDICNAIKDSKGNFWFSTLKGLCKFTPEEANKIEKNYHVPFIVLSSFKSKEGTYNEDGIRKISNIRLYWPDNSFEFKIASLDYADPEKNQHAYKLEGFDKGWNYIGTHHFGRYTNIPPGEYVLKLKGSNNDGVWNEVGDSISILISPPFWMTWWFKGVCIMLLLAISFVLYQLKTRGLKKRTNFLEEYNIKLQKEIEERTKAEKQLAKTMSALHNSELDAAREHAMAETAAQVAHDIRSPLTSLNMISKTLSELPEEKRILIRNATQRINDIANNLLQQHKTKINGDYEGEKVQETLKSELLSILMDSLVSEKRIQMERHGVNFILDIKNNAYSSFVSLDPNRFKRMLSNLINNSLEALPDAKGFIKLTLEKESDRLIIKIIDNGKGIPEDILPAIKKGGITVGKKEGAGLGVAGAIQNIKNWNGEYDILSKEREGTTFVIKLPIIEAPDWFQCCIIITQGQNIVALDDDKSIHDVWKTLFQSYVEDKLITLHNFYKTSDFVEYIKVLASKNDLFLMDYEFLDSEETGLDLIEKFNLSGQAILVTSHYDESEIVERVKNMGIKIIPKNFAMYIPISINNP